MFVSIFDDESGATLVEALAFTVIAIIFVISAVALWNMASNSANAQNAVRQYQAMQQDIQDLFQGQDDYSALSGGNNQLLVDAEVIPEDLRVTGTTPSIIHAYGGTVTFDSASSISGEANQRFSITYSSVPKEACINIASTIAGTFNQVDVNGTPKDVETTGGTVTPTGAGSETDGLPLGAASAQQACANASNALTYYSR